MVGELAGLAVCPDSRCAMSEWSSEQDLDARGCNLCPPCELLLRKVVIDSGIAVSEARQ